MGEATDLPATRDPDQQTLEACRRGQSGAFDVLVERHQRRVFRLAVRLLGDEEAALDAAQETFVKAWRALPGFQGGALFTTWLTRIAINQCRNEQRRRATLKHGRPRSLDTMDADSTGTLADGLAGDEPPVSQRLEGAELKVRVQEIVRGLAPEDREVLLLREVESLSYEDISEVLDVPLGTVRSRLHRARAEVRRRLGPVA